MGRVTLLAITVTASCVCAITASAQQPYPTYPSYPSYPTVPYPQPAPGYPTYPSPPATTGPGTSATLPAYRPPVITLAQPADGVVLPDDKPVAVLRFAALEQLDPIDALSLSVTVDGEERTSLFTLTQGEAWGRLSTPGELLSPGQHELRARICSARGACGVAKATVTVVSSTSLLQRLGTTPASQQTTTSRGSRVLGAVLQAVRVLIK